MASNAERRRRRKITRAIQSESAWLQKALFALRKVEEAHEKLADARDEVPGPYALELDGHSVTLETLEDALQERVQELLDTVRERRRSLR